MTGEIFLDTSILIGFMRGAEALRERLSQVNPQYLPFISAAELLYGAKHSDHRVENLALVQRLIGNFTIVYPDRGTLETYSDIKMELRMEGYPIPENDIWLAALTRQHQAVLVSTDEHFQRIRGLQVENWLAP